MKIFFGILKHAGKVRKDTFRRDFCLAGKFFLVPFIEFLYVYIIQAWHNHKTQEIFTFSCDTKSNLYHFKVWQLLDQMLDLRLFLQATKGGLISESFFTLAQISKTKMSNHYPPKAEKMIRIVVWHPFMEIWTKVKHFLRLSYL